MIKEIKKIQLKKQDKTVIEKDFVFTFDPNKHTLESAIETGNAYQKELSERQEAFNKHQKEFQEWQETADKGWLNKELYEEEKHKHLKK